MHTTYIVCGGPGAGKSTYAKKLASAREAVLLDIDTVTERLVRIALREAGHDPDDRDSNYFKRTFREPIYETLFDIARENLSHRDVVVVGPFTQELKNPGWPSQLSRILGGPVQVHYVACPRKRAGDGSPRAVKHVTWPSWRIGNSTSSITGRRARRFSNTSRSMVLTRQEDKWPDRNESACLLSVLTDLKCPGFSNRDVRPDYCLFNRDRDNSSVHGGASKFSRIQTFE